MFWWYDIDWIRTWSTLKHWYLLLVHRSDPNSMILIWTLHANPDTMKPVILMLTPGGRGNSSMITLEFKPWWEDTFPILPMKWMSECQDSLNPDDVFISECTWLDSQEAWSSPWWWVSSSHTYIMLSGLKNRNSDCDYKDNSLTSVDRKTRCSVVYNSVGDMKNNRECDTAN